MITSYKIISKTKEIFIFSQSLKLLIAKFKMLQKSICPKQADAFLLQINKESRLEKVESIYTSYYCKKCKRTTILITEELNDAIRHGNYISCAFCGSKKVVKEKITDSLKEVMSERKYKRVNGAFRQY